MVEASHSNRDVAGGKAEKLAQTAPRVGAMVTATKERVKNTRRIIAQSRQLVTRARQTLESSRLLRVAVNRRSEMQE
ncbi:MAG TPA: hypothetical protein VFY05_14115 [Candidatus Angelobacter sp.]|nr:hypothetical protein [Candidatus Angelobacter sp.]